MNGNLTPYHRRLVRGGILALVALAMVVGVVVLTLIPPTADSLYPGCNFYRVTGLHCPGCGTTRALHALLNGKVTQALAFNALSFIVLPVVLFQLFKSLWYWLWDLSITTTRTNPRWPFLLAGGLLLFWILRNIPAYPFTLLAPHEL